VHFNKLRCRFDILLLTQVILLLLIISGNLKSSFLAPALKSAREIGKLNRRLLFFNHFLRRVLSLSLCQNRRCV